MEDYKILLGVKLDTKSLKSQIDSLNSKHDIKVGVNLAVDDIRKRISAYNQNSNNAKLKLGIKLDTDDLKRQINALNKGGDKNVTIPINTQSLQDSLKEVKGVIESVQKSLGILDDASGMKSLVASVNQIANALGKAEDESNSLINSLKALSGKDFGVNVGLKIGGSKGNPVANSAAYGNYVRGTVIPQLREQANSLMKAVREQYSNQFLDWQDDTFVLEQLSKRNGYTPVKTPALLQKEMADGRNLSKQMSAYREYINLIEEVGRVSNVNVGNVTSGFSATKDELIQNALDIQAGVKTATEGTEESLDKLKKVLGSGLDVEGLSGVLEPLIGDIKLIREAIESLSTGVSVDGLTTSFKNLSTVLDTLAANLRIVQDNISNLGNLGAGLGGSTSVDTSAIDKIEQASDTVTAAVVQNEKKQQEAYKATANQLDILKQKATSYTDVKQFIRDNAKDMKTAGIKNSETATQLWKDANYEKNLQLVEMSLEDACDVVRTKMPESFLNGWFREADSDYKSKIENLAITDKDLRNAALNIAWNNFKNISGKNISLKDFAYSDIPVYRGKNSEKYVSGDDVLSFTFDKKVAEKFGKHILETTIKPIQTIGSYQTTGEAEIFVRRNQLENRPEYINWHENMSGKSSASAGALQQESQQSQETANTVVQGEERKQQAYQETSSAIENLKNTLMSMKVSKSSIDSVISDIQELGFEATDASVKMNNGDFDITVKGIDSIGRAITEIRHLDSATGEISGVGRTISQSFKESDAFIKKQKQSVSNLTNQINQLHRSANDQNAPRAIKDSPHLSSLADKYDEITAAIQKMENASADTFVDEQNNVKKLIAEYKSLVSEYKNAENVSSKMKGTDFKSGLKIAENDLAKFKAQAQGIPQIAQTVRNLDKIIAEVGDSASLNEFNDQLRVAKSELAKVKAEAKATDDSFDKLKSLAKQMGDIDIKINSLDADRDTKEILSLRTELDGLETEYNNLYSTLEKNLSFDQLKELDKIFANTIDDINKFKNALKNSSETDELNSDLEKLKSLTKEIANLNIDLFKAEDTSSIERISNELYELEKEAADLRAVFQQKFPTASLDQVDDIANKGAEALQKLVNKAAEAKAKLAKDIKVDFELGNYEAQMANMYASLNKLSGATDELENSIRATEAAYDALEIAASQSTDDEIADRERLIQAEKEYARALQATNNLIKVQTKTQAIDDARDKLDARKQALQLDMANYLKANSRAAKEFGAEIQTLSMRLETLDNDFDVNKIARQFQLLQKRVRSAGKEGLTVFDQLKSKIKEYSAYFSVAEMFMYAQQAMREMFNTVKEIDTAMTGLYRVTDLTAAQYDALFDNMIDSAKEYGATLNDIINATTDWVRAGFDADTSLGLAEVTTMYQHISDLDYNTAAENLITAYNGFKDELNGAFDGDTVGAVNYIADIFNKLDNEFAVTSAGLGEALTRSASALDLAGNSIQETAGMVTGIVEVTQDPEKAGSALKVLSLRLRGMKGQLEELGEETDENVENISKMQGQILNMTSGKVNIFDGAGNFKSTYEIMRDIAAIYDDLSSTDQADLLETIAGKNRANDVAALLSNWEKVELAVKAASEAEGSAAAENAKYMDSIQGRLDKLTTTWQSFATTFLESDVVKGAVSGLTAFVEIVGKLVDKLGALGTIGLGAGIFGLLKNRNIFGIFSSFLSIIPEVMSSTDRLGSRFKTLGGFAKNAGKDITKSFGSSLSGAIGGIGLLAAAFGLAYNAIKNYKESISESRQKTIQASDGFLNAADSFEQAYIKYSGRTDLTAEEESELETAIKGTVDALGDKSSALQDVVNGSNDYLASLESIKNAELEAAKTAAKNKKDNAELELQDAVSGWFDFDGSEVNIDIPSAEKAAANIAEKMNSEFFSARETNYITGDKSVKQFVLQADADTSEIVNYYHTLLEYQKKLSEADLIDTQAYDKVSTTIEIMSESIKLYTDGVYEAAKAQYQLSNGIPKTTEKYLEMRKAILDNEEIKNLSLDTKKTVANTLDEEYSQIFDLSTAEVQARKLIGILDEYGDIEANEMETFLNMRTAVNSDEVSVGKYLSQFDDIEKMTQDWSEKSKKELNTSFGLDTDSIKQQYEDVYKYINRNYLSKLDTTGLSGFEIDEYKSSERERIDSILKSLSASELEAVVNIKGEIDWETTNTNDILAQIKEEAKFVEAMNFTIAVDVETEGLEAFNTAMAESVSATGLSSDSITALKGRYAELENQGYDLSSMFEETSNGIHLNRNAISEFEQALASKKLAETKGHLEVLKNRYNELGAEIKACDDVSKRADLYRDQQNILDQINNLGTLAAQYEGLASAYNAWQNVESAGSERDMYESIIEGFETIGDEISRGWYDDGTIKFLELLTGKTDLVGKSAKELKEIYQGLDKEIKNTSYSVRDFFTVDKDGNSTSTGAYNFLKALEQLEKSDTKSSVLGKAFKDIENIDKLVQRDADDRIVSFDFNVVGGDKAVADALGISEEMVQIIQRALDDAGFVVTLDGKWTQFADLKEQAEKANDAIKKLAQSNEALKNAGFGEYEFDFGTSNIETLNKDFEKAKELLNSEAFKNKETGKFDLSIEGAEEAQKIAETLLIAKQQLEEPAYMSIKVEELQTELQEPVKLLQDFETKAQRIELLSLTPDINAEEIKTLDTDLDTIAKQLYNIKDENIKVKLGIEGKTPEEIREELENGTIEVPTELTIEANMDKSLEDLVTLGLLEQGLIDEKTAKIRLGLEVEEVDTSDVDNKVEEALEKEKEIGILEKEQNIRIIADTFGLEDVSVLKSALEGLDDKTIQAIAEVLGRTDVDLLKNTIARLDDKTVQAIAEAIGKGDVDGLKNAIINIPNKKHAQAIAQAFGYSDVNELANAVDGMDGNVVQAVAQALGLTDVYTLRTAVTNMQGNTVDAKVNTDGQKEKISALQRWIDGLKGRIVEVGVSIANGGKSKAAQRTGADPDGKGTVNGTANVNGTIGRAFKQGSWGTKNSGTALVGELGREVLVREGRYYTIGDNGAEFIKYKKGDIIFNHVQSEQLFRNGKVTAGGGRAKAFAGGTAFKDGLGGGEYATVKSFTVGYDYKASSNKDSDKSQEVFDWIEVAIKRIEREIDNLDTKANSVYRSWSDRNNFLAKEIDKVSDEITLQKQAIAGYQQALNQVGLSSDWAKKVQNGAIDIDTVADEVLKEKISHYQEWYEKILECEDAILELTEKESDLIQQKFDNIIDRYDGYLAVVEHEKNMLEEYISQSEAQGWLVSEKYYQALSANERDNIAMLEAERNELLAQLNSGEIQKETQAWFDQVQAINEVTEVIEAGNTALLEYAQTIQELKWEQFDLLQDKISAVTEEADFLIELLSNDKLYDDNGKLTNEGMATMGQHGVAYNAYMYQADLAREEAEKLKAQMSTDKYDEALAEKYRERISQQQEFILNAEKEKDAIKDLVEEGIELELDALQERIDLYNEALDSQKD